MNTLLQLAPRYGRRRAVLFTIALLLQAGVFVLATTITGENLIGIALAAAFIVPFFLPIFASHPYGAAILVPLLVIVPGSPLLFNIAEYVLLIVTFMAILRAFASGSLGNAPSRVEAVFVIYVGWSALTLSQAIDLRLGLEGFGRIMFLLLAFLVGNRVVGRDRVHQFLCCLSFLPVLVALELVVVILRSGYPISALLTRIGALTDLGWGYSNFVAAVATLPVAAAIPLVLYGKPAERVLGLSAIVASGFVSIVTVSRGGTLVLALGLLTAFMLEARRRSLIPLLLIIGIGSAYVISPFGRANLDRFVNPQDLPSVGVRLVFYQETLRVFGEHWLLGIGPDQIAYHTASLIDRNPHNIFLKNMAEFGVIGILLYAGLLFICLREAVGFLKRAVTTSDRMVALTFLLVLIMAIVNASFEPTLESTQFGIPFWMTVGVCMACASMNAVSARTDT